MTASRSAETLESGGVSVDDRWPAPRSTRFAARFVRRSSQAARRRERALRSCSPTSHAGCSPAIRRPRSSSSGSARRDRNIPGDRRGYILFVGTPDRPEALLVRSHSRYSRPSRCPAQWKRSSTSSGAASRWRPGSRADALDEQVALRRVACAVDESDAEQDACVTCASSRPGRIGDVERRARRRHEAPPPRKYNAASRWTGMSEATTCAPAQSASATPSPEASSSAGLSQRARCAATGRAGIRHRADEVTRKDTSRYGRVGGQALASRPSPTIARRNTRSSAAIAATATSIRLWRSTDPTWARPPRGR